MRPLLLALLLATGCAPAPADPAPPPRAGAPADTLDLPAPSDVGPFASETEYRALRERAAAALDDATTPATAASAAACRVFTLSISWLSRSSCAHSGAGIGSFPRLLT